jgi:hypothetical protein
MRLVALAAAALCALAGLGPIAVCAQDAGAQEIYAYAWSAPASGSGAHLYPMLWFTPSTDAAALAIQSQLAPAGRAGLFLANGQRTVLGNPADACLDPATKLLTKFQCPYLENGTRATQQTIEGYLQAFQAAGGRIDALVLDSEIALSNWVLGTAAAPYDAIQNDPRWDTLTYPQLIAMGSAAGVTDLEYQPLAGIGVDYSLRDEIGVWNELMYERVGAALYHAVATPLQTYFPGASMSDYGYSAHNAAYPLWDPNGWPLAQFGNGFVQGTHGAPMLYGEVYELQYAWLSPSGREYPPTPFNGFRYDLNTLRAVVLGTAATDGIGARYVKVAPWVPYRGFSGAVDGGTDYYQETLIHAVLAGADYLLFWNPPATDKGADDDAIASAVLSEINGLLGFADRHTLVRRLASWVDSYVVTTAYANGLKVSRITADVGIVPSCSVRSASLLVCTIGAARVRFPSGSVHRVPRTAAPAGLWVLQPGSATDPY